jgi:hypothetical protein
MIDISLTSHHSIHPMKGKKNMKIEEEEEDIRVETKEIKNEDVESSFRASISRFSYPLPSSPPSARRTPKRPSPGSNPNRPISSPSLTVTVAVAQPTPAVTVRPDESNNDGSVDSGAVQALRRSPRKRKGETRPLLDAGDGDGGGGTSPSKKMKKMRRGNPRARAREVDLSHLPRQGALPEYLAEDLDGTFLPPNPSLAAFWLT